MENGPPLIGAALLLSGRDGCRQSTPSDRDRAGDRPRPGADCMTVVAGLNDPLPVLLTDDFADMVRPNDNGSYPRRSRPTPMGPVASKVK